MLETDLWGQISVLCSSLLFFFSAFWLVGVLGRGMLETDLWGQINVLFCALLFSAFWLVGGDPEKIAALRAGELRILARGAALKKIAALRAREFVRAL